MNKLADQNIYIDEIHIKSYFIKDYKLTLIINLVIYEIFENA
jgi:hypothetical protein